MKKIKILILFVTAVLCVSLVFAGCKKAEEPNTTEETPATQQPTTQPTTAAPKTSEPPKTEAPTPKPMTVIFSDDFSGDLSKWDANYGGDWAIKDGKVVVSPAADGPKLMAKDTNFKDFVLEAEMSVTELRENQSVQNAGFVFRASEPGTGADAYKGYYIGIAQDHAIAGKAVAGTWIEFGTFPLETTLELGDIVKVRLEVKGSDFAFYVDDMGTPVAEWEDTDENNDPYESGSIGLRIWQNGASFDNIKVGIVE